MKKSGFLFVLLLIVSLLATGQDQPVKDRREQRKEKAKKAAEKIKELIKSGSFVFIANQALPMGGGAIQLTSPYDLKIKGDSAFAYLPYYGVAYRADYGSSEGGIKFSEPVKDYKIAYRKSSHEITFKVNNPKDNYSLQLIISDSGSGTLGVTSIYRQFISFYGKVEPTGD